MIEILNAANAIIATRQPLVQAPQAPFGYGTDCSVTDDFQDDFGEIDGPMLVLQAIYRDLITPPGGPDAPGSLPDDTEYGLGINTYIQRELSPQNLLRAAHEIEAHILRDDRVDTVQVDVALDPAYTLTVTIQGDLATGEGFRLVFALTDAGALLQELTANV